MKNIAILHYESSRDISSLLSFLKDENLFIFTDEGEKMDSETLKDVKNFKIVEIPHDYSRSQAHNFISKYAKDNGFKGFFHVIEDSTEILKDPFNFMTEIERMMDIIGITSWFNTVCDRCNYVFDRYNPRARIHNDAPDTKDKYDKILFFCSNANTQWIVYNLDKIELKDMLFNEEFSIPMYYIIEYLARRRNEKKENEMYYMNFYPSIEDELGVFRRNPELKEKKVSLKEEGEKFKKLNINHKADTKIEPVLKDYLYNLRKTC